MSPASARNFSSQAIGRFVIDSVKLCAEHRPNGIVRFLPLLLALILVWPAAAQEKPKPQPAPPAAVKPASEKKPANPPKPSTVKPAPAVAKPVPPKPAIAKPPAAPPATSPSPARPAPKTVLIYDDEGKLVPILRDASLDEFLEWVKTRQKTAEAAAPQFSVTSVNLEGTADDDRAQLTAKIGIQIHPEDQWVKVPLRLNEAVLRKYTYHGKGEAIPDDQHELSQEYHWWFKGKGQHELELSLSVPILKQLPTRRLQLSLPPTAVGYLKLQLGLPKITVKVASESAVKTKSLGKNGSLVEVFGLPHRLEMTWQPLPDTNRVESVLQAVTSITADVANESVLLKATQRVQAFQGSFSEIRVRLPAGFDFFDLECPECQDYTIDEGNYATVTLSEPTTGPIELKWTLHQEFLQNGGRLVLEGFEVDRARRQTGEMSIHVSEGYQLVKRDDQDRYVHRVNVANLTERGSASISYRFLKQPFRLVGQLQEIASHFTVEPDYYLHLAAEQAELISQFRFRVYRGTIQEVRFSWPSWKEQGWVIEPFNDPDLIEDAELSSPSSDQQIVLKLLERQKDEFVVTLRARRAITAGAEPFEFSFPTAFAPTHLPAYMYVAPADNVDADITPLGETSMRPIPLRVRRMKIPPDEFTDLRHWENRLGVGSHRFSARVEVRDQTLSATTTVSLQHKTTPNEHFEVTQEIDYEVGYERLEQIRLMVPEDLQSKVRFLLNDEVTLEPYWTGLDVSGWKQARLTLPGPLIGSIRIVARYPWYLPQGATLDQPQNLVLPLIRSSDLEYLRCSYLQKVDDDLQESIPNEAWKPQSNVEQGILWTANGHQSELPLSIVRQQQNKIHRYEIPRTLVRSLIAQDGRTISRIQYRIEGTVDTLTVAFPEGIKPEAFWLNQRQLTSTEVTELPGDQQLYRVTFPEETGDSVQLLSIDYHTTDSQTLPRWFAALSLLAPRLADDEWVDQTVWEVVLPVNQHLFNPPANYLAQYEWTRDTAFFRRTTRQGEPPPDQWIGAADSPSPLFPESIGPNYRFSRFGPPAVFRLQMMGRPLIVLLGAGLTLAVGFVLVKIPSSRNVLSLISLLFVVAVLGVFFPAPMSLLAQPAVLGLALAIMAALIDRRLKRSVENVLTFGPPSDLSRPSSPAEIVVEVDPGSEEPTAVRKAPPSPREPVSSLSAEESNR